MHSTHSVHHGNVPYWNVTIDYELIESWEASFVPEVLVETAITIENNYQLDQREGYTTSLEGGSYENDFGALHEEVDPRTVIRGSFLSDEEGQNQNKQIAFIAKPTELVIGCAMGTHGLCPRFLDTTSVDTTYRLGFRGTKVLHVIRKSVSSLLFFKSILRYLFVLPFL